MKILLVSEDIPAPILGGLGKHVVRLGNALIQAGHDVSLMGGAHRDYESNRAEVGFEGRFIPGFSLDGTGWKEAAFGTFIPYKRPAIAGRIAQAILAHAGDYDVVHYHGHYPMVGQLIPTSVNFVQTRHDQGSECLTHMRFRNGAVCDRNDPHDCAACALNAKPGAWRRQLAAVAVRQYRAQTAEAFARHKTVFVSDFLRQAFLRRVPGADGRKCHVLHNFIDTRLLPSPQPGDPSQIFFVGRIDQAKGVTALLDALRATGDNSYHVDVIGDGPDRAACESRHASPRVRFHGWKLQADALAETARAGRIVVPSIWEEPCGTTILEGLALGKPVHALARGGTPELKRYERWAGQLHLYADMDALARGLLQPGASAHPMEGDKPFGADIQIMLPEFLRIYSQ
jgi:glycosyltransferase involved in cell wall biosynthesis